jgi:hypothetical protein
MGVAAYNRSSDVIRRRIEDEARPAEFEVMDRLNALEKYPDAGTPFGPIQFVFSHGGCWAQCPIKGSGFWYKSLYEAVRRWRVDIVGFKDGAWNAVPRPIKRISVADCLARR